jgi:hypothetical protein
MSFRSRHVGGSNLLIAITLSLVCLPGCCSSNGGKTQGSRWAFMTPSVSLPARRASSRPARVQTSPKAACPNGSCPSQLPSPDPQLEVRPPVQPAPEPTDSPPAPEDEDPMSVPLPAPPRLPTQARKAAPRQIPPLPEMPDLSDATPKFRRTEKLPAVPQLVREPINASDSGFSAVPRRQDPVPIPRVAARLERDHQPVHLEAPEPEVNATSIHDVPAYNDPTENSSVNRSPVISDPFDDEPRSAADRSAAGVVPEPEAEENLELSPVPAPPTLEPMIETQSLESTRNLRPGKGSLNHADAESDGLPPHSAQALPRNQKGLRVVNLHLARNLRVGPESAIDSESLRTGQKILVRGDLAGHRFAAQGTSPSRLSYHVELVSTSENVVFTSEQQVAMDSTAPLSQWLIVPAQMQPGTYRLRLRVQDGASQFSTQADMPVRVL